MDTEDHCLPQSNAQKQKPPREPVPAGTVYTVNGQLLEAQWTSLRIKKSRGPSLRGVSHLLVSFTSRKNSLQNGEKSSCASDRGRRKKTFFKTPRTLCS